MGDWRLNWMLLPRWIVWVFEALFRRCLEVEVDVHADFAVSALCLLLEVSAGPCCLMIWLIVTSEVVW